MTKGRTVVITLVLALAAVAVAGYVAFRRFVGIAETGSGGIGAVSAGFGEMIVELVIAGLLVAVIWAVMRLLRRRRLKRRRP